MADIRRFSTAESQERYFKTKIKQLAGTRHRLIQLQELVGGGGGGGRRGIGSSRSHCGCINVKCV